MNFNQVKHAIENNDTVFVGEEDSESNISTREVKLIGFRWDSSEQEYYAIDIRGKMYNIDEIGTNHGNAESTKRDRLIAKYTEKLEKLQES